MNDTATMTIKQTAEEFARARQRHDWREIAGEWFEAPVRRWIGTLDADGEPEDDTGDAVILAVGMREFLALRDVMLVAAIRGERTDFTADRAIGFLRRPMMRDNVRWMEDMPAETFHGSQAPDRQRCMKAVELLLALIGRLDGGDDGWQTQPYATVAYILWWLGDERALPMAVRALARDEGCSLAIIVASAIHRRPLPDLRETCGPGPEGPGHASDGAARRRAAAQWFFFFAGRPGPWIISASRNPSNPPEADNASLDQPAKRKRSRPRQDSSQAKGTRNVRIPRPPHTGRPCGTRRQHPPTHRHRDTHRHRKRRPYPPTHHPHMADPQERRLRHPHHRRPSRHPIGKRHVGTSDINGRRP